MSYAASEAEEARRMVLALARKYEQTCIYQYRKDDGGSLSREVVWCDPAKQATCGSTERVDALPRPPDSALGAPEWRRYSATNPHCPACPLRRVYSQTSTNGSAAPTKDES